MRHVATMTAVIGFFVLSFVGWFNDVDVFICGMRAVGGALVLYVVVGLAGTIAIRIIADAAVQAQIGNRRGRGGKS
jgi:hypothetical protein